jgi:hypothetical protein
MAIEGPLRELGIHDVFQLLDLNRKTGVLRVTSELRHNDGSVWFTGGAVVYAEIRSNPHPLGDMLVRVGKITDAELRRAHAIQQEEGKVRRIGDILVENEVVTSADVERHVRFQVEEVIFEMMGWHEGYFSFSEEPVVVVPGDAVTVVRIETLLMEGARRIDEWSRMERRIPHVGVIPSLAPDAAGDDGALDLLPTEWEVLALVDGERDIRGIANALARSDFDVAKTVFGLDSAGVLMLSAAAGPVPRDSPARSVDEFMDEANGALAKDDLEGARGIIETALGTYPHEGRLYVQLGTVHLAANRPADAEEFFRRGLRLDSLLVSAHRLLGDALARQGRLREATAWWGRTPGSEPGIRGGPG